MYFSTREKLIYLFIKFTQLKNKTKINIQLNEKLQLIQQSTTWHLVWDVLGGVQCGIWERKKIIY